MRKTAKNTIKVLAKRVFVLLLTGLLLLPGNDVYAIGNRTNRRSGASRWCGTSGMH